MRYGPNDKFWVVTAPTPEVVAREVADGKPVQEAWQVQFLDASGKVLFGSKLR